MGACAVTLTDGADQLAGGLAQLDTTARTALPPPPTPVYPYLSPTPPLARPAHKGWGGMVRPSQKLKSWGNKEIKMII